jgi:hypothetical protein
MLGLDPQIMEVRLDHDHKKSNSSFIEVSDFN